MLVSPVEVANVAVVFIVKISRAVAVIILCKPIAFRICQPCFLSLLIGYKRITNQRGSGLIIFNLLVAGIDVTVLITSVEGLNDVLGQQTVNSSGVWIFKGLDITALTIPLAVFIVLNRENFDKVFIGKVKRALLLVPIGILGINPERHIIQNKRIFNIRRILSGRCC